AHGHGIVHRDLTPANILLGPFGEAVVIDWGLAKDLHAGDQLPEQALTAEGAIVGSPAYMPPEQARGQAIDERADVYALGAILYELLAGRAPYAGSARNIVSQVRRGAPPSLDHAPAALIRI